MPSYSRENSSDRRPPADLAGLPATESKPHIDEPYLAFSAMYTSLLLTILLERQDIGE